MARIGHGSGAAPVVRPPCGSVRSCIPYRGELARHRLITADGHDVVVATATEGGESGGFITGAYPVQHGFLVMARQPLCELRSASAETAREQHEQLVRVLAEAGVQLVRARRSLLARRRAERDEAQLYDTETLRASWLLTGAEPSAVARR